MPPYHLSRPPTAPLPDPLYIIAVIANPVRYASRYTLYRNFAARVDATPGAILYTVELAFGARPWEVTEPGHPRHLQLRTTHELWHKENLINLGIARLPLDWRYVAWVDADVTFTDPNWAAETVQALQHYSVVQMFAHAIDSGPQGEPLQTFKGFLYGYCNREPIPGLTAGRGYSQFWHPGFAWAARRAALDTVGGLLDCSILGSADHLMAHALIGHLGAVLPRTVSPAFTARCLQWEARAAALQRNVGYVPGTLLHHWHGKKRDRQYADRWQILFRQHFDPDRDLKRDWQGVYQLTDRAPGLRDDLRAYFRARNEDSVDPA